MPTHTRQAQPYRSSEVRPTQATYRMKKKITRNPTHPSNRHAETIKALLSVRKICSKELSLLLVNYEEIASGLNKSTTPNDTNQTETKPIPTDHFRRQK